MTEAVLVRPRGGHILAGIPATGAYVPESQADDWVRNGLVVRVTDPIPQPVVAAAPVAAPRRKR